MSMNSTDDLSFVSLLSKADQERSELVKPVACAMSVCGDSGADRAPSPPINAELPDDYLAVSLLHSMKTTTKTIAVLLDHNFMIQ